MAISNNNQQIKWAAADSKSIAASANSTSDELTLSTTTFDASIVLKAKNNGTPAAGDVVTFRLLYALGDPDGTGSDEFDTVNHAIPIELDTNSEDPAIRTVKIDAAAKKLKLYAANGASSNGITVSAELREKRG